MLNHNILHKILLKLDSQTWYKTQLASSYFHICYKNNMYQNEEKILYKESKLIDSGVYIFDFNNINQIQIAFAPENHQWLLIKDNLKKSKNERSKKHI